MSDVSNMNSKSEVLVMKNLNLKFRKKDFFIPALQTFSLSLFEGEILGLVGESGCGKTTLARVLMGLEQIDRGEIFFFSNKIDTSNQKAMNKVRRQMQMIFQDPYSSIDPLMKMKAVLREPMRSLAKEMNDKQIEERTNEIMSLVGLDLRYLEKRAKELSGGQRQRVAIARAIACQPDILLCDEPVSALDVSVQAQILNLLKDIQTKFNTSMIFISHDLGVVRYIADRICVMLRGRICELGTAEEVFSNPKHPYTQHLLQAVPHINRGEFNFFDSSIPDEQDYCYEGCPFRLRCDYSERRCAETFPDMVGNDSHSWACFKAI